MQEEQDHAHPTSSHPKCHATDRSGTVPQTIPRTHVWNPATAFLQIQVRNSAKYNCNLIFMIKSGFSILVFLCLYCLMLHLQVRHITFA